MTRDAPQSDTASSLRKLRFDEIERPSAEQLESLPRHPIVVVVDHVRSAHNVGSILRTADAARLERVYLTGISPAPGHRAVAKASLGAEDTVPWTHEPDIFSVLDSVRARGYFLVALEQTATPTYLSELSPAHAPIALVVGNEVDGVQQAVLNRCDAALEVRQYGAKHSLNVSVAFGVAVYGLLSRLGVAT